MVGSVLIWILLIGLLSPRLESQDRFVSKVRSYIYPTSIVREQVIGECRTQPESSVVYFPCYVVVANATQHPDTANFDFLPFWGKGIDDLYIERCGYCGAGKNDLTASTGGVLVGASYQLEVRPSSSVAHHGNASHGHLNRNRGIFIECWGCSKILDDKYPLQIQVNNRLVPVHSGWSELESRVFRQGDLSARADPRSVLNVESLLGDVT